MLQPPDIAAQHDEYLKRYLETGEEHIIGRGREERGKRKDGSVFPMYLAVSRVEINGTFLRVNDKLCQIVDYSREELLSKTFQDIIHPDDLDADLSLLNKVITGELPNYSLEKRYTKNDKSEIWINLMVSLVRHEGGAPNYFISVIEDIDLRRQAEKAKAESEKRFRTLVDNVPGAVYRSENDENWTMRFISDPIGSITG